MHAVDSSTFSTSYRRIRVWGCIFIGTVIFFTYFLLQQGSVITVRKTLHVWNKPEERIKRPTFINKDHGSCGSCPADKQFSNAWQLIDLVAHIHPKNSFLVNIGAASYGGGVYDPTHSILTTGNSTFGALLIDPSKNPSHFNAYPTRNNIQIKHDYIWSEDVVKNIFERYQISKEFAILKLDIDSYECSVLESILGAGYRPDLIHTEFNPIFPPPVVFQPIYNQSTKHDWKPPLWSTSGPFYGCSLSALSTILSSFDYVLLQVEFWDVVYIRSEIAQSTSLQVPLNDRIAYEVGFVGHSCFPYCQRNPKLFNQHIANAIKTNLNQSNFTEKMMSVLDLYAPISMKNNLKHPYIMKV